MFYYHIRQSTKPDKDLDLKEHINHIYHQHKGRYGYRRITSELNNQLAQKGMVINHKRVQRLMAKLGLKALVRRQRKFNTYKGTMGKDTIQDNILKRDFKADKPNQKWATDITEFKVQDKANDGSVIQRKLYLLYLQLTNLNFATETVLPELVEGSVSVMVRQAHHERKL
ncbi:IS3 family transposase [Moraxella sp. K1664]|uniref:IS3 family transposase n=1 Tax=Moraxella sp. K1664 TaxID=2780077 RepID=UPI003217203A